MIKYFLFYFSVALSTFSILQSAAIAVDQKKSIIQTALETADTSVAYISSPTSVALLATATGSMITYICTKHGLDECSNIILKELLTSYPVLLGFAGAMITGGIFGLRLKKKQLLRLKNL